MSYKSPIDVVLGKIQTEIEENSFKAAQEYGIHVDKDELMKALKYDRGQYDQGYYNGYNVAKSEIVRCKDCAVPHNKWTGCPHLNGLIPPPDHYCAKGERKEQE